LCFNFNIRKGEANTKQTIALLPTAIDQKLKSVIAREKDISCKYLTILISTTCNQLLQGAPEYDSQLILFLYSHMHAYELQNQEGDKSRERESEMQHTFALSSADMPRASGWYNCPDFTLTAQAVQQPGTDGHIHTPLVVNKLEMYNPEHKLRVL
jgi:hypothetical protein